MAYTPTSLDEFPLDEEQGRVDLAPGIYDGKRDVLFFAKMPGTKQCNTIRVKEVLVADGLMSATVLQPPYGDRRPWTDMRSLEGKFTYVYDSVTQHYNVAIHPNVARLTIKATAIPSPLKDADFRAMEALEERVAAEAKEGHK